MYIDLSKLTGKLLEIAKFADENSTKSNGKYLDSATEVSLFFQEADKAVKNGEIVQDDINAIFGFKAQSQIKTRANSTKDEMAKRVYLEQLSDDQKADVTYKTRTVSDEEFLELAHKLDQTLIQNEITGTGAILNRLHRYDIDSLAERYTTLQTRFNKVEYEVENWFKDPNGEKPEMVEKQLFEENVQSVLGMTLEKYKEKYAEILLKIAALPQKTSTAATLAHLEAIAKFNEEEKLVYNDIVNLNKVLSTNFNAWENDIMYNSIDITSEANMEVIESLDAVSWNEYADESDFEMPKNWLVKKNFLAAIDEISGGANGIENINNNKQCNEKKYIKDGQIIIEKTLPNGEVRYFDSSGKETTFRN